MPLDFRDRYFTPAAAGYQLSEKVRAQVRLRQDNFMSSSLLAGEAPYHFVFCRNLLIYFAPDTQRRAVQTLRRLTAPQGLIFVGPAEASLLTREGLASAGVPLCARTYEPGEWLVRADDPATHAVYFIAHGFVQLYRQPAGAASVATAATANAAVP